MTYTIYHDKDQGYWVGAIVRDNNGRAMFVQQIGNYYQYKAVAERHLKKLKAGAGA